MDKDISRILKSWEYQPDTLIIRKVAGDDGNEKIQIRINLGILQMEAEGRPDGKTPHNSESLLEYYDSIIEEFGEADRDGDMDIYVSNWGHRPQPNKLYRNNGDGTFTDISDETGLAE